MKIVVGKRRVTEQLPQWRDAVVTHVENAGAERRAEPLVQAAAVVVAAAEVAGREIELSERMRAIDHDLHAVPMRHFDNPAHRQDLSGDVDHMTDHQQARLRCDRIFVDGNDLFVGFRLHGN